MTKMVNETVEDYLKKKQSIKPGGKLKYDGIDSFEMLKENMKANCIPESVFEMEEEDYKELLLQRRKLIAGKIKNYYQSL